MTSDHATQKCVIYVRVSSAKQASDGTGLSSQVQSCRSYARERGYSVEEVFSDVVSGTIGDRSGLKDLLKYLRVNRKDKYVVIVDDVDRFARDVVVFDTLGKQISQAGAHLESPKFKFGHDAHSQFMTTLRVALGQLEARNNFERAQGRVTSRLQQGYWTFAAPAGYRFERQGSHGKVMVRDEPVASIVAEALNGYATGRFQSQAEVMNRPGFPGG